MTYHFTSHNKAFILEANNYRDFIKRVISVRSSTGKKFGYAELARASNFSARSYPRDIVLGHKNPTLDSFNKLALGLGLSQELQQFFTYLYQLEVPSGRTEREDEETIKRRLNNLKLRILESKDEMIPDLEDRFFFNTSFLIVEKDRHQMKEDLKSLLLKYADKHTVPEGTTKANLSCVLKF